jgi:hypothetical protein
MNTGGNDSGKSGEKGTGGMKREMEIEGETDV